MNSSTALYALHERIWHWLQAAAMMFLILTGMAIHYPDRFPLLGSMANAIQWHAWIGFALILNAFLGIFYHLTAEKYHHFLPRMDDFTGAAVAQARFYLCGIFKGEKHPLETDPRRKLNSLQKITYLALLNILLPYQIVTGVLMWGADRWPQLLDRVGGLWMLGPAHTLGSYLFLAFLIGHIYLATIGPTPWSHLRAMTVGRRSRCGPRFSERHEQFQMARSQYLRIRYTMQVRVVMPRAAKCEFDDQVFEMQVRICKAFANTTRLRMLDLLAKHELTVSDIQAALGITTPNVSQHLSILKGAGVVATRRSGKQIYCSLALPEVKQACQLIRVVLRAQVRNGRKLVI